MSNVCNYIDDFHWKVVINSFDNNFYLLFVIRIFISFIQSEETMHWLGFGHKIWLEIDPMCEWHMKSYVHMMDEHIP
jgi:hypothetical protein